MLGWPPCQRHTNPGTLLSIARDLDKHLILIANSTAHEVPSHPRSSFMRGDIRSAYLKVFYAEGFQEFPPHICSFTYILLHISGHFWCQYFWSYLPYSAPNSHTMIINGLTTCFGNFLPFFHLKWPQKWLKSAKMPPPSAKNGPE